MKKNISFIQICKRVSLKSILLLLFFMPSLLLLAQENFVFENYSIPQGLSNPTINCIYEDKFGFLWIGTEDGLCRYDGYEFKVYKNNPTDITSLPNNKITSICEDKDGNMWIGGFNVLVKYQRENDRFIKVKIDREQNINLPYVQKILVDKKNRIWIGTDILGVHILDPKTMTTKRKKFILNNEELNNAFVNSIIETSDANILVLDFGSGVFYYDDDTDRFRLYENLSIKSISKGWCLHEDEFNRLWIGGENSLKIYSKSDKKISSIDLFTNLEGGFLTSGVFSILKDKSGFIWLATLSKGLYRYNPANDKFFHFDENNLKEGGLKSSSIASLFQDSFGNIWIGTLTEGLYKVDPNKQPMNVLKIPDNIKTNTFADIVSAVAMSKNTNNVAIGTLGVGLIWKNLETGQSKNFSAGKNSNNISGTNISSLTIDEENNVWVGTQEGLDKVNPITGKIDRYYKEEKKITNGISISDLEFDSAGRLFIAYSGGVDIFYPSQNFRKKIPSAFNRQYNPELQQEIINLAYSSKPIVSLLQVGEQKLLQKEFEVKNNMKVLIIGVGEGQPNLENMFDYGWIEDKEKNTVWSMQEFIKTFHFQGGLKNRIVFNTMELTKGKYKLNYVSDVGNSYGNYNVQAPKDSALWGVQLLEINDKQFKTYSELIKKNYNEASKMLLLYSTSIAISKYYENTIWIGTRSQGLFKYNLADNKYSQYKQRKNISGLSFENDIYNLMEDSKGFVWYSSPNGLVKFDPKDETKKLFTEKDGLPTNLTAAIQEDNYGNLWISSAAGLTTLVRSKEGEKETFVNINIKDGLQGYSFSQAACKSKNGELFFGGENGINYFVPGRTNQTKPKIVLTDFKISDVSVFENATGFSLAKDLNATDEIKLSYSQNDIAFQFSPVHYSRPERNLIAYKLEGFNNDWVYSKLRFASFTNLDPGEYVFRLKAANGDGIWSDEEKAIRIIILPPYWRTTFAYFFYASCFFGLIFGIDRVQRRRLLTKERNAAAIKEADLRALTAEAQSRAIQAENDRKSKELEEARELQLSMLPKQLPQFAHLDIAVYMKTATEVGGDYYDFNVGIDGTLTVVLGDATGHGMRAGTMVTSAKSLFNSYAANPDILFTFQEMSRCIKQMQFHSLAMCMTMLKIQNNKLVMSAAGMPPVYLFRNDSSIIEEHLMKGMPLGTMENFPYELKEVGLFKGDTLLLMSDGFPELQNEQNEIYGYNRARNSFEEVAKREPEEIISYLKEEGRRWTNDKEPEDDVTFVVIKVK